MEGDRSQVAERVRVRAGLGGVIDRRGWHLVGQRILWTGGAIGQSFQVKPGDQIPWVTQDNTPE